jgi:hypothetical protein
MTTNVRRSEPPRQARRPTCSTDFSTMKPACRLPSTIPTRAAQPTTYSGFAIFLDFAERICLVAQGAGAGREAAVAGAAVVQANCFQFLETAALGGEFGAAAIRAALRRLDRRSGRGSDSAVQHEGCHSIGRAKSHEFAEKDLGDVVPPSLKLWRTGADSQETGGGALVTDSQRDGRGRVGRGFARSWEEKVRRGRGLADWGLTG